MQKYLSAFNQSFFFLCATPIKSFCALLLLIMLFTIPINDWLFHSNLQRTVYNGQNSPKILVYLHSGATESQGQALIAEIQQRSDVNSAVYIEPLAGMKQMSQELGLGDVLAKLTFNPLPAVIEVLPTSDFTKTDQVVKLSEALQAMPLVSAIQINLNLIKAYYSYLAFWHKLFIVILIASVLAILLTMQFICSGLNNTSVFTGIILGSISALLAYMINLLLLSWLGLPIGIFKLGPIFTVFLSGLAMGVISAKFHRPE